MGLFGHKKQQQPESKPQTIPGYDPLAAIPRVNQDVEFHADSKGTIQIRRRLAPRGKIKPWIEKHFGLRKMVRVNLDEHGSAFWNLIDGKRSLNQIELTLRKKWNMDKKQSKTAVMEFTKMLMRRTLINLSIDVDNADSGQEGTHE